MMTGIAVLPLIVLAFRLTFNYQWWNADFYIVISGISPSDTGDIDLRIQSRIEIDDLIEESTTIILDSLAQQVGTLTGDITNHPVENSNVDTQVRHYLPLLIINSLRLVLTLPMFKMQFKQILQHPLICFLLKSDHTTLKYQKAFQVPNYSQLPCGFRA